MFKYVFLGVVLVSMTTMNQLQGPSKPVYEVPMEVSYLQPPPTVEGATRSADAVVVGKVESSHPYQPPKSGATLRTAYQIDVLETLKADFRLVPDPVVFRFGGDRDEGKHIRRSKEVGFPDFKPGKVYVLFLSWNPVLEGFELKYGPNSTFELQSDGTIQSPGRSEFAKSQVGKPKGTFLTAIRSAAKQGRL